MKKRFLVLFLLTASLGFSQIVHLTANNGGSFIGIFNNSNGQAWLTNGDGTDYKIYMDSGIDLQLKVGKTFNGGQYSWVPINSTPSWTNIPGASGDYSWYPPGQTVQTISGTGSYRMSLTHGGQTREATIEFVVGYPDGSEYLIINQDMPILTLEEGPSSVSLSARRGGGVFVTNSFETSGQKTVYIEPGTELFIQAGTATSGDSYGWSPSNVSVTQSPIPHPSGDYTWYPPGKEVEAVSGPGEYIMALWTGSTFRHLIVEIIEGLPPNSAEGYITHLEHPGGTRIELRVGESGVKAYPFMTEDYLTYKNNFIPITVYHNSLGELEVSAMGVSVDHSTNYFMTLAPSNSQNPTERYVHPGLFSAGSLENETTLQLKLEKGYATGDAERLNLYFVSDREAPTIEGMPSGFFHLEAGFATETYRVNDVGSGIGEISLSARVELDSLTTEVTDWAEENDFRIVPIIGLFTPVRYMLIKDFSDYLIRENETVRTLDLSLLDVPALHGLNYYVSDDVNLDLDYRLFVRDNLGNLTQRYFKVMDVTAPSLEIKESIRDNDNYLTEATRVRLPNELDELFDVFEPSGFRRANAIWIRPDGARVQSTAGFSFTAEGTYRLGFEVTDNFNNTSNYDVDTDGFVFHLDRTDPQITWPFEDGGYTNKSILTISNDPNDTGADIRILEVDASTGLESLDESRSLITATRNGVTRSATLSSQKNADGYWELALAGEGDITLEATLVDMAGRSLNSLITVYRDVTPPVITAPGSDTVITYFNNSTGYERSHRPDMSTDSDGWYPGQKTLYISTSDDQGIASNEVRIVGMTSFPFSNGGSFPLQSNFTIYDFTTSDLAGNTVTERRLYGLDQTNPFYSLDSEYTLYGVEWSRDSITVDPYDRNDESGINQTMYRFDGGEWQLLDSEGKIYLPDNGNSPTGLSLRVQDNAGNFYNYYEEVGKDNVSPQFDIVEEYQKADDPEYWFSTSQIYFQATDLGTGIESAEYTLNGAPVATQNSAQGRFLTLPSEGQYVLGYSLSDFLNEPTTGSVTINFDETGPTFQTGSSGYTNDNTPQFSFNDGPEGVGIEIVEYKVSGEPASAYSTSGIVLEPGTTLVDVRATDFLGNSTEVAGIELIYDDTPPNLNTALDENYSSAPTFTITGSDTISGLSQIRYTINNGSIHEFDLDASHGESYSLTIPRPEETWEFLEGHNKIHVVLVDKAGNESTPTQLTANFDYQAPSISIVSGLKNDAGWYNTRSIPFTVSDSRIYRDVPDDQVLNPEEITQVRFEYSLDGGTQWVSDLAFQNSESNFSAVVPGDGSFTIHYRARDNAGNLSSAASAEFSVDTLDPEFTLGLNVEDEIFSPARMSFNHSIAAVDSNQPSEVDNTNYQLGYEIDDPNGDFLTGGAMVSYESFLDDPSIINWSEALEEGLYSLSVTMEDQAGNQTTRSRDFYVDGTAPDSPNLEIFPALATPKGAEPSTVASGNDNENYFIPAEIFFPEISYADNSQEQTGSTLSEEATRIRYYLNLSTSVNANPTFGPAQEILPGEFREFPDTDDVYYAYVKAVDPAGNESETYQSYVLWLDNFGPGVSISSGHFTEASQLSQAVSTTDGSLLIDLFRPTPSGLESLSWDLYLGTWEGDNFLDYSRGSESSGDFTIVDPLSTNYTLEFNGLASNDRAGVDNTGREFYRLEVNSLGKNGIPGDPVSYVFRVDNLVPQDFTAVSPETHPTRVGMQGEEFLPISENDQFYSSPNFQAYWVVPKDKTGLASVEYKLEQVDALGPVRVLTSGPNGFLDITGDLVKRTIAGEEGGCLQYFPCPPCCQ